MTSEPVRTLPSRNSVMSRVSDRAVAWPHGAEPQPVCGWAPESRRPRSPSASSSCGRVLRPRGRCPHRGRDRRHRHDAGAGQGMGDPDVRHRGQVRSDGARARGHRRAWPPSPRSMESAAHPGRQCGDRLAAAVAGMRGGAGPPRAHGRSTSSPPWSARCAASRCCVCSPRAGRFEPSLRGACHRRGHGRARPKSMPARRLSLVTFGYRRARACSAVSSACADQRRLHLGGR